MTTWGNPIQIGSVGWYKSGAAPEWLGKGEEYQHRFKTRDAFRYPSSYGFNWFDIDAIRLPADHWAYKAIDAGYTPWAGGGGAPDDWDGSTLFMRDGEQWDGNPTWWTHDGGRRGGKPDNSDIIGYKRRSDATAPTVKLCDWCSRTVDTPEPQPLYNQARRLLEVLCERYGAPVTLGLDVAEILTQIDNVTTGVHLPTLDRCTATLAQLHAMPRQSNAYDNGVRYGFAEGERQLEALRPAPADPVEALAIELAQVAAAANNPDGRSNWEIMSHYERETYRAMARHTLDRPAKT